MKKEYIKPSNEVIKVNCQAIIALSTFDTEINDDNKDDFDMMGREDNTLSGSNVWEQGW